MAAAARIINFSDEDRGRSLCDFTNDIWIKRDNYGWNDEQVAHLIVECCTGCARMALKLLPSKERTTLKSVLRCLEEEFYSEAKQTASSMVFNSRVHHHGETEREYAHALQQLVQ